MWRRWLSSSRGDHPLGSRDALVHAGGNRLPELDDLPGAPLVARTDANLADATAAEATEAGGAFSVGYHADASELAPTGWLTGSEWDWGPLYTKMVKTILDGEFTGSEFNANFRVGYKTGTNPFVLAGYGPTPIHRRSWAFMDWCCLWPGVPAPAVALPGPGGDAAAFALHKRR